MLQGLGIQVIISYVIFSFFSYHLCMNIRDPEASSGGAYALMSLINIASLLFGVTFLIYIWWKFGWTYPAILFVLGMIITIPLSFVETIVSSRDLGVVGIVAVPACAIVMGKVFF